MDGEATYSFDLAMISAGLVCFGRGQGSARHLECGVELAAMLAREAAQPRD